MHARFFNVTTHNICDRHSKLQYNIQFEKKNVYKQLAYHFWLIWPSNFN